MNGLYKKRYGIGIYKKIRTADDTDELVELFDTAQELAIFIGKSLKKTYDILGLHFSKKQKEIVVDGKLCEIAFIDMVD